MTRRGPLDPEQVLLGQAIRGVRADKGLTQKQVAERSGVHVTYISDIERGARNPSWKALATIARGIGVPLGEIAERYDRLAARGYGGAD